MKATGAEIKQFYDADWEALLGLQNAVLDEGGFYLRGSDDEVYPEKMVDTTLYTIRGWVSGDADDSSSRADSVSLTSLFAKWRKAQKEATVSASGPKDNLDEVKAALASLGWKVQA